MGLTPVDVVESIRAKVTADLAIAKERCCTDTLEEARAAIVGEILEAAELWAQKAADWDGNEQYCNWRAHVYQRVLELLDEGLYD